MTTPDPTYGPPMFFSDIPDYPKAAEQVNEPLPRAWAQGGLIESVKRAVIQGLRESFNNSSIKKTDQEYYISIDYPTDPTKYPGLWVQFNISKITAAGLGMGVWVKNAAGEWGEIQEKMFEGNITLSIAAESSKDRDRLADTVIAQLAFTRSKDLAIRDVRKDTNQMRGLLDAIDANPYVSMTLNTDNINPGGATVTSGTPWAPNILLYEDVFSIGCQGQINLFFGHDGTYTLTEIRTEPVALTDYSPFDQPRNSHRPSNW